LPDEERSQEVTPEEAPDPDEELTPAASTEERPASGVGREHTTEETQSTDPIQ